MSKDFSDNLERAEGAVAEIERLNVDLERRVAERTAALQASNEELEAFCYSVSHDLRTPLRGIDGFSQALVEDYGGELPAEAQRYLQFVRQGVQRMGQLIDDLLGLSRLSRKEIELADVDLAEFARDAFAEAQAMDPKRTVHFESVPAASAKADAGLVKALITNLISNAWKFSAQAKDARIEFGVFEKDGSTIYYVRDNGAGFDMAYYDKLFGAFQRLHSAKEFQGTGVGLATVRRIARRHGGDAWAEGKVGEGATFFFSLPG